MCNQEEELLLWHQRLAHMPFTALQHMAKVGHLPKRLAKIPHPKCQACMIRKAKKVPWRVKGQVSHINNATKPGEGVSVDQLESSMPGLIAQLKGIPTIRRYKYVTVFVDNYTRFMYVQLQQSNTSDETLQAKKDFESLADRLGVRVSNYHADNGRFANNSFIQHCRAQGQGLTYCGVHAHFQNSIAERRIRDLKD
jgi:GAG-pre-integrase domain